MTDTLAACKAMAEVIWQQHAGAPPTAESDDLAAVAERFIEFKRHLGHRYASQSLHIRQFVGFLHSRGIRRSGELSIDAMLGWAASRSHLTTTTWQKEVNSISVLMGHLKDLGLVTNNLCWFLKIRPVSRFRPYIFTTDELRRIFGLAARRTLIYRVIYACGLRVSEAAHLRLRDFNESCGTIFIAKSKFRKDRLLPLHPKMLGLLVDYRESHRVGARPEDPFFVTRYGRAYEPVGLGNAFRKDLRRLGIYQATRDDNSLRYGSPRIHSLRHAFAIHRLLRWYREGADVQAKLPLLSTYMGHVEVASTQVYLRITGVVLRVAHERFAGRWEQTFPLEP